MGKKCCVPTCPNTIENKPKKLFLAMPRKPETRMRWCEAIGIPFKTSTLLYVCVDHFDRRKDILNWFQLKIFGGKPMWRPDVIPTLKLGSPTEMPQFEMVIPESLSETQGTAAIEAEKRYEIVLENGENVILPQYAMALPNFTPLMPMYVMVLPQDPTKTQQIAANLVENVIESPKNVLLQDKMEKANENEAGAKKNTIELPQFAIRTADFPAETIENEIKVEFDIENRIKLENEMEQLKEKGNQNGKVKNSRRKSNRLKKMYAKYNPPKINEEVSRKKSPVLKLKKLILPKSKKMILSNKEYRGIIDFIDQPKQLQDTAKKKSSNQPEAHLGSKNPYITSNISVGQNVGVIGKNLWSSNNNPNEQNIEFVEVNTGATEKEIIKRKTTEINFIEINQAECMQIVDNEVKIKEEIIEVEDNLVNIQGDLETSTEQIKYREKINGQSCQINSVLVKPQVPVERSLYSKFISSKLSSYSQQTQCTVQHLINKILYQADNNIFDQNPPATIVLRCD